VGGKVDQKIVKKRNGTRRTWFMHRSATSSRREESWVILKRGGWLPGVLCETTEFVSVILAELDRVSDGRWLERPGVHLQTKRGTLNVRA
jgi:hypothetical protein